VIVTHARIIGRSDEAEVLIPSLGMRRAVVLKKLTDPLDLVFLKVEGTDLESEPLQNSNSCREGEEVIEIGFPFPEKSGEPTLTRGIMRNCNGLYQGVRYLQVDQGGSPESIGSPLINSKGEVIAISKGKLAVDREEMNVGLPIKVVRGVMEDKLAYLEEKIKEREKFYKYVYDDFWVTVSSEYQGYQKNLLSLYNEGKLSAEEAYVLEKNPLAPPAGFSSLKNWIADLAERVRNEEITREKAIAQIKGHFDLSYLEKSL
jgi:S1-C subfamily serine protease